MRRLEAALVRLDDDLRKAGVGWALVGGLAVSARSEPRFTRDIDAVVAVPDDAAAEILVRRLLAEGYRVLATLEQEARGRLATVRLSPPGESAAGVVVDLLFASSGVEREIVEASERVEIAERLVFPVARIDALIALKVLSRDDTERPQDLADLRSLLRAAAPGDVEGARTLLGAIESRGFGRGRRLIQELERLLEPRD
jgi:hypothetical protein